MYKKYPNHNEKITVQGTDVHTYMCTSIYILMYAFVYTYACIKECVQNAFATLYYTGVRLPITEHFRVLTHTQVEPYS